MDKKSIDQLNISLYELSDLANLFAMKITSNSTVPFNYGTGEEYTAIEAHTTTTIYLNPGITAKEIADKTARTQSAVSQIVSKLENKGLIKTQRDMEDGRKICMFATEKGEKLSKAHIRYDEKNIGSMVEMIIEKYGIDAMNNYINIFSIFTNDKNW